MATPTQSPAQPVLPIPTFVYNHDTISIANRLGRFITELVRSNSSNLSTMTASDQARLKTYLDATDALIAHIIAAPELDLPKTGHSVQWPVEPLDPVPAIDNEDIEDLVRLLTVAHAETLNSESSNSASGLTKFDSARLTAIIAKTRSFLLAFVATSSPLDLPASSPMDTVTPVAKL